MLDSTRFERFRRIVGDEGLVTEVGDRGRAEGIVAPGTADEVAGILAAASEEAVPVTPRGAGTGLSGGATACEGGVVLSTRRMRRIVSASEQDLVAVVEPGVATADFQRFLEARGLFYPADPVASGGSTVGGNVGEALAGLRSVKYGGTRNALLGMKVALPSGEILRTGARTLKCVTGYDLARLFAGSMGTLGVWTELWLKILPAPESRVTVVAGFDRASVAAGASSEILSRGILPSILEMMDRRALRAVASEVDPVVAGDHGAVLVVETDGLAVAAERQARGVEDVCRSSGAQSVRRLENGQEIARSRSALGAVIPAFLRFHSAVIVEEIRMPRSRVADMVDFLAELGETSGAEMAVFGHVGDGRLDAAILTDLEEPGRVDGLEALVKKLSERARSLGGRLARELRLGAGGRAISRRAIPPGEMALMKRLKEVFDPKGIMNPGKLF